VAQTKHSLLVPGLAFLLAVLLSVLAGPSTKSYAFRAPQEMTKNDCHEEASKPPEPEFRMICDQTFQDTGKLKNIDGLRRAWNLIVNTKDKKHEDKCKHVLFAVGKEHDGSLGTFLHLPVLEPNQIPPANPVNNTGENAPQNKALLRIQRKATATGDCCHDCAAHFQEKLTIKYIAEVTTFDPGGFAKLTLGADEGADRVLLEASYFPDECFKACTTQFIDTVVCNLKVVVATTTEGLGATVERSGKLVLVRILCGEESSRVVQDFASNKLIHFKDEFALNYEIPPDASKTDFDGKVELEIVHRTALTAQKKRGPGDQVVDGIITRISSPLQLEVRQDVKKGELEEPKPEKIKTVLKKEKPEKK